MSRIWFRSRAGSSYGPASREGWAVLAAYTLGVSLITIILPMLAGDAIWSWLLAATLVVIATIWLFRIVRTHSNRSD